jgi:adenine-specific DNA-methyltransferase
MQLLTPESGGSSKDILAENIAKLKELFPEVFAEGKIDFDALKQLLGEYVETADERYNFTWNGKSKARWLAQTRSMGTLRPCPEESVNWDTTQNLFIEGDNLEVLKLLQKSYYKKIKMIYIDPPYNTGNDFIYPDNFRDSIKNYLELTGQTDGQGRRLSTNPETSGRFHTDWLNMMYPRLKLARNLLSDDGVIFVSIGSQEIDNLKKICSEIFGEENFAGLVTWKARVKPVNVGGAIYRPQNETEFVLIYEKSESKTKFAGLFTGGVRTYPNELDGRKYRLTTILKSNRGANFRTTMSFELDGYSPPEGQRWQAGEEVLRQAQRDGYIEFKDGTPFYRRFEDEEGPEHDPFYCFLELEWTGTSEAGKGELNEILGNYHGFDTVKPTRLLSTLVQSCATRNSDAVVLDFFSGSGTTAHAVLELNKQDGGNRKFIMVQLPEPCYEDSEAFKAGYKNIAEIGKERIRRVIKKLNDEDATTTAKEGHNPALFSPAGAEESAAPRAPDRGFKVFKLDSSNIKTWDPNFNQLEHTLLSATEKMKPDRTEADVIYEVLLKYGLDLTLPIEKRTIADRTVYVIGGGSLVVCLAGDVTLDVVEKIAELKDEFKPENPPGMRVVFKDNGFAGDELKTNAVQILKQRGIEDVRAL